MQTDPLRPHLDQDRGFGLVGEGCVEFVDMPIEGHAVALPPLLVKHAGDAIAPFLVPGLTGEGVDHPLARGEKLREPGHLYDFAGVDNRR